MAKENRNGNRKPRDKRTPLRVPDLGYYVIVTDTQATERLYFEGIKDSIREDLRDRLVIKVFQSSTANLIEDCKGQYVYDPIYREPWIVFDRDQVVDFDRIIAHANAEGIKVGWSNPCFEVFLFGYFGRIPAIDNSVKCCKEFSDLYKRITHKSYSKSDKDLYKTLCRYGDEEGAIKKSREKYANCVRSGYEIPSKMCPCNTVYELVAEIRGKAK